MKSYRKLILSLLIPSFLILGCSNNTTSSIKTSSSSKTSQTSTSKVISPSKFDIDLPPGPSGSGKLLTLDVGEEFTPNFIIEPSDCTYKPEITSAYGRNTYYSIDENNVIKGLQVTNTNQLLEYRLANLRLTVLVSVKNFPKDIKFSQSEVEINQDEIIEITVTAESGNLNYLTYESLDDTIAKVDYVDTGKFSITGKSFGDTKIKVYNKYCEAYLDVSVLTGHKPKFYYNDKVSDSGEYEVLINSKDFTPSDINLEAKDSEDGDISSNITLSYDNVDFTKEGTYYRTYEIIDSDLNTNEFRLRVYVKSEIHVPTKVNLENIYNYIDKIEESTITWSDFNDSGKTQAKTLTVLSKYTINKNKCDYLVGTFTLQINAEAIRWVSTSEVLYASNSANYTFSKTQSYSQNSIVITSLHM